MTEFESNDEVAFWAHNLTVRALAESGVKLTHEQADALMRILYSIAAGELTIAGTPAEMIQDVGGVPDHVEDMLWRNVNSVVEQDRLVAGMIKREFDGLARGK